MIKENRIIFGHGTVVVGSSILPSAITFQETTTAHIVGEVVEHRDASGENISICLDMEREAELSEKLLRVENRQVDTFLFCGYEFDFTTYNPESIRVIREHARTVMQNYLIAIAC